MTTYITACDSYGTRFTVSGDGQYFVLTVRNDDYEEHNHEHHYDNLEDAEYAFNSEIEDFDIITCHHTKAYADHYDLDYENGHVIFQE